MMIVNPNLPDRVVLITGTTGAIGQAIARQIAAKRRKKAEREADLREQLSYGQDEHFAFIIGYTSDGFPYGVTWDEWAEIETAEAIEELVDEDEEQGETDLEEP